MRLQKPADVAPPDIILLWCKLNCSEGHIRQQLVSDSMMPVDAWFGVGLSQNTVISKVVRLTDAAALTAEMCSCRKRYLELDTLRAG